MKYAYNQQLKRSRWWPLAIAVSFALAVTIGILAPVSARPDHAPSKADICHYDEDTGDYIPITISERAVNAHFENHGDGYAGGDEFDEDCEPVLQSLENYDISQSAALNFSDGGFAGWSALEGTVVTGGGFELTGGPASVSTIGQPGESWPHYTFGADEYGWVVQDAPDGEPSPDSRVYNVHADKPDGYEVVTSSALAFGDGGWGGWSCPAGKVVLGGGFEATAPVQSNAPAGPDTVWPHYTFGSDEYGWVVQDAQDGVSNTITVYAVCADPVEDYEIVSSTAPLSFSDTGWGGWSCPADKVVTGGGFVGDAPVAASAPADAESVWPHYTFSSDEYGWVLQSAPDGQGSSTSVYAVCASQQV